MSRRILRIGAVPIANRSHKSKVNSRVAYLALSFPPPTNNGKGDTSVIKTYSKKFNEKIEKQWQACKDAQPSSLRGKVYYILQLAISQIDPHELFVAELHDAIADPTFCGITICITRAMDYHSTVNEDVTRADFICMLERVQSSSTRLMAAYTVMLPFTAVMSVLPAPNVLFLANIMRLYYLWMSKSSSQMLLSCITTPGTSNDNIGNGNDAAITSSSVFVSFQSLHVESPQSFEKDGTGGTELPQNKCIKCQDTAKNDVFTSEQVSNEWQSLGDDYIRSCLRALGVRCASEEESVGSNDEANHISPVKTSSDSFNCDPVVPREDSALKADTFGIVVTPEHSDAYNPTDTISVTDISLETAELKIRNYFKYFKLLSSG